MAPRELYILAYLGAAATAGTGAALAAWNRRAVAAPSLAAMLAAGAWWAALGAVDVAAATTAGKLLASQVQYLGVVSAPPLFLATALALLRGGAPAPRAALAAAWAVPLAVLALALTNGAHGLVWREVEVLPGGLGVYHYGPAFWVFAVTSYAEIALGTALVALAARRGRIRRRALALLAACAVIGWSTNAAYVFKVAPWPGFDWTVVGWTVMGAGLAWAVVGHGLLDLVPRAREAWLEATADGVLVLDLGGRLLHANPAARALLGPGGGAAPSAEAAGALADAAGQGAAKVIDRGAGAAPRFVEARMDPLPDGWGRIAGRLLTVRDVTARREAEAARERMLADLTRALGEVRALRALLPICASCKKIRDEGGRWSPVDRYLSERAVATFTHGFCPECVDRLYPPGEDGGDSGGGAGR